MNQEQRQAYEWAKSQNYQSVAARYAKVLAGLVDEMTPPNEPLTIQQLREMGGQPVWVKCLKPDKYTYLPVGWRILKTAITGNFGVWNGNFALIERDYGTDWLAYRRPPEGEA